MHIHSHFKWLIPSLLLSTSVCSVAQAATVAQQAQDILAKNCYSCHGPDRQKSGLRLDSQKDALYGGDSGEPVFVSGKSQDSLLIKKITASDPKERMPAGKPALSSAEIDILKTWIDEGVAWAKVEVAQSKEPSHWSFKTPVKAPSPEVPKDFKVRNPIDAFIGARLESEGLSPMPEADRATLVRRVYLETVGLPPTPEQTRAFVKSPWPGSYNRLLKRLFASPHYGERQSQQWLDVARFADTNGYEKDKPRSIWPYRDWIIQAYNDNMPFDQFVIEQIAGDLLPNATESQRVATGFHRNTMLNEEGGIDAAEDWFKRTIDRTNTTGAAFLGLTVGCAQCHTHKSDPITRTEYYRFFAFFNNAEEQNFLLQDAEKKQQRDHAASLIEGSKDWTLFLAKQTPKAVEEYTTWLKDITPQASEWVIHAPVSIHSRKNSTLRILDDGSVLAYGDIPNDDTYTFEVEVASGTVSAIRIEVLPHDSLPFGGPGRGNLLADGDFLLSGFEASVVSDSGEETKITIASATHDFASENRSAEKSLDGLSDTGWSVKGEIGKAHRAVYQLESPVTLPANSKLKVILHQDYIHQHVIGRLRIATTTRTTPAIALIVPADIEAALVRAENRAADEQASIEKHYYTEVSPTLEKWRKRRDTIQNAQPSYASTLVMAKRDPERVTHVYNRGEFKSPKQVVDSGVPKALHELPETSEGSRLDLAHWLVSRENPLLARVTMNRLWQQVFGKGLVITSEDFGIEGEAPSHPKLLDWLAVEFMDSDWDLQHMHRMMLTSATFRRQSSVNPELLEKDPQNTLLARGPRLRLDAEVIRDLALSTSGLLVSTIGGPSVFPPQPAGANSLAYGTPAWPTSKGDDRYRRGIYTYIKRTAPYPGATVFDAPTREESCLRRQRTNTPLQALTLLNDEVYVEAMRTLAKRISEMDGSVEDKTQYLYMLMMSRSPATEELVEIQRYHATQVERFSTDTQAAKQLLGLDEKDETTAISEWAAWTALCRVILNTDEVITRG